MLFFNLLTLFGCIFRYLAPEERSSGLCCSTLTPLTAQRVTHAVSDAILSGLPQQVEYKPRCSTLVGEHVKWRKGRDYSEWECRRPHRSNRKPLYNCQERYPYALIAYTPKMSFNLARIRRQKPKADTSLQSCFSMSTQKSCEMLPVKAAEHIESALLSKCLQFCTNQMI